MAANKQGHGETIIKKVSKRGDDAGHGGAWKVAFADFVLALMCLFMVLWVLAARDKEEVEKVLMSGGGSPVYEGSVNMVERNGTPSGSLIPREPIPGSGGSKQQADSALRNSSKPSALGQQDGEPRVRYDTPAQMKKLAEKLSELSLKAGLAGHIQTVVTPWGLRVMLHDTERDGMFERGSAVINPRFRALLNRMGEMFTHVDNQLLVVGHTDSLQYKAARANNVYSNWTLSSSRALSARSHLLEGGMPKEAVLQVVGMADRAPLDAKAPAAAPNRRIELLVLTSGQSQAIKAMFGAPGKQDLAGGVATQLPAQQEIEALRRQLPQ